jgi:hypothetical protein
MPSLITSKEIERCLRACLAAEGFELSAERAYGQTGADICARRGGEQISIEVIGFKSSPPARAKDFYESFFRAISRLDSGAPRCVIALPSRFGLGLPARARQHGQAWARIGNAFPELEIWLVDAEAGTYSISKWGDWRI